MAYCQADFVAQFKVCAYVASAKVEIAVFHAQVITAVSVFFDGEGWCLAGIEYDEFAYGNLDVSRRYVGIL